MKKSLFVAAIALVSATTLFAQSKLSNYTKLLIDEHKTAAAEQFQKTPMGMTVKTVNGQESVDCFVHFVSSIDESILARYGATLHCRYDFINVATAAVPVSQLEALAADPAIKLVEAGQPVAQHLDLARTASLVSDVQAGTAPLTKSYYGKGVIVGVVDNEIQYDHPEFWNSDHSRFRIKRTWLQSVAGSQSTVPSDFNYGREIKDSASILSQKYDTRTISASGHGCHVTGIAAGADHSLDYYGVAGESDIIFVSSDAYGRNTTTTISDGIKYVFDYAATQNKPCVVNVSMGNTVGPHDGTSTDSRIIDGLVGRGRIACGSAGNSGDSKIHCGKTLTSTDTSYTTFPSLAYGAQYFYADVYGQPGQEYWVQIVAYNKATKAIDWESDTLCIYTKSTKAIRADSVIGTYGRLKFRAGLTGSVNTLSNRGNISVIFSQWDSVPSRHNIGIRVISHQTGMVHMWSLETYGTFTNSNQKTDPEILDGDYLYTVDEPMGVTDGVISVGSYVTRPASSSVKAGSLSSFSSNGPTADGRFKPDIAAPGEYIVSSVPDLVTSGIYATTTVGGNTYNYASLQGTSMSSPFCAGTIATWLEADSTLTPDRIRDVFRHTAMLDSYTGDSSSKPDNNWGYGKLNAYQGLLYVLGLTTQVQDVTTTGVLAAYPNPTSDVLNIGFPSTDSNVRVAIYDLSGKCVYSNNLTEVAAGQSLEISVSSLANGAYIVKVAGDKLNDTFKLMKE